MSSRHSKDEDGLNRQATSSSTQSDEAPTPDEVFDALSNRRRRFTLQHLTQCENDTVSLQELSERVAAWEIGTDPRTLAYDDRKNVYTSLYQFHAPKMDEFGIVDYDRNTGTVSLTEHGETVATYLEPASRRPLPWSGYFLLLSVCGGLLVTAVLFDVPPTTALPDAIWGILVVAVFLVASGVLEWHRRRSKRRVADDPPPEWVE
ncbi:MAG: DUF7344 domain-containing protein [Halobacteriota archaeon]